MSHRPDRVFSRSTTQNPHQISWSLKFCTKPSSLPYTIFGSKYDGEFLDIHFGKQNYRVVNLFHFHFSFQNYYLVSEVP